MNPISFDWPEPSIISGTVDLLDLRSICRTRIQVFKSAVVVVVFGVVVEGNAVVLVETNVVVAGH